MEYKHLKTGNIYAMLGIGIDNSQGRKGTKVAIYKPITKPTDKTYIRELDEFNEKFKPIKVNAAE